MSKTVKAVLIVSIILNIAAAVAYAAPMVLKAKGTVSACLSTGQVTAIRNILKTAVCGDFEEMFELSNGSCNADFLTDSWIHQVEAEACSSGWKTQTTGQFPGDWQPIP